MSYALKIDWEIMDRLTYVQWEMCAAQRVVVACAVAGSDPVPTYNCAFQRMPDVRLF
jgi:hypothetical protein